MTNKLTRALVAFGAITQVRAALYTQEETPSELEPAFETALDSLWMAYQPIVSLRRREVVAYEGLLRVDGGELGSALAIIRAAEELRRLHDLGRRTRAQVAERAAQWPELSFFVNVHPKDLLDEQLFDPEAPLSRVADKVVLEVTERASLDSVGDLGARIRWLRSLGFRIAVDDLGAGYAGLKSLLQLQPDVVKLDMALIRGIDQDEQRRKLVGCVVALCRDLGALVVAEGVETRAELDALVALRCDLAQGFFLGRPARELRCGRA
jgi:EAL domain-containing protein (putative c-di-GMP-specific phosphodiesterase class I)